MLVLNFAVVGAVHAEGCSEETPCGNGPIVPQLPGWRFLKSGTEDCPFWYPSGCYTPRGIGEAFIPLN